MTAVKPLQWNYEKPHKKIFWAPSASFVTS